MKTLIWQHGYGDGIFGIGDGIDEAIEDANRNLDKPITADEISVAGRRTTA